MESEKKNKDYKRAAAMVVCFAGAALAFWAFFSYVLPVLFPFLLGLAFGLPAKKAAGCLSGGSPRGQRTLGAIFYFLFLATVCLGAAFAVDRLANELLRLASSLSDGGPLADALGRFDSLIKNLTQRLPIIKDIRKNSGNDDFWMQIDSALAEYIENFLSEFAAAIPKAAKDLVAAMPKAFVFGTVAIISGFFIAVGGVDFTAIKKLIPHRFQKSSSNILKRAKDAAISWLRAYLLILGLTFFELFIGFSVLGVNYSFLAAIAVSLVDFLPIFGVGTVLLPWAAISFFTGDSATGIGLLTLWAIISVVRQFAEPRIVGKSLGIPPILTLISMYAGLCFFGVSGMIAAPAVLTFVKLLFFEDKNHA